MIIENPDVFKSWLTSILEPLCDADPAALAKYVYALVKKDKPVEELREVMVDQLDVFLQQETKPFVEMLFKSLECQEYLKPREGDKPPEEPEVEKAEPEPPAPVIPGDVPPPAPRSPRRVVVRAPPPRPPLTEQTLVKVMPLNELLEEPVDQPPRRRERRVESLRDKEERRRRRSRSAERRARPRRHPHYDDRNRRVASRSPSPRRYRNRSPPTERQPSRSRSRSPVPVRDRELLERERERVRAPRELERDRMSRDREHRDRVSRDRDRERSRERSRDRSRGSTSPRDIRLEHNDAFKRRCRDFDEKGYCMRGDLCEWDHGLDPVVLEDTSVLQVPEYNPLAPNIWMEAPFAAYPPPPPRELIPIPRVRQLAPGAPAAPRHAPPPKKNFDYNRIGMPRPPLPANAVNCSLEVKKVPRGLNDITHLNNHFSKFGKIVNIQVCYEGDPEAALMTFSSPAEANVAYKSTEAVLNNRFIKVFWHNPDNKQENLAPGGQPAGKPAERAPAQHPMSHNKVLINRDNIKATADTKQANIDKEKESKQMENGLEPKKEAVKPVPVDKGKRVMEMYKRGQELLQTQLHQQRLLINKLESGNVTGPQKTALMEAINSAQEGIEKLRKELVAYNGTIKQLQVNTKRPKTREEAQKEILDAELDMFTKQNEGQDVTELAKKIAELRKQMAIQYPTHVTVRRPHSRGGRFNTATRYTRGGINKVFTMNQSVDHRPRALLISGFETDDTHSLYKHFAQFGEICSKELDLAVPQLVLQYRTRAHAEQALLHGRHYNDRTLSITWVTNAKVPGSTPGERAALNGDATTNENKEEIHHHIADTSLFEEEDEEEREEDRSWRR